MNNSTLLNSFQLTNIADAVIEYSETVADDFDEHSFVHCFKVLPLLSADLDFINFILDEEYGIGEIEISTLNQKIFSINYITDDNFELSPNFIEELGVLFNNKVSNYIQLSSSISLH